MSLESDLSDIFSSLPEVDLKDATSLHTAFYFALLSKGYRVGWEQPTGDRGNGRDGRIDLLVTLEPGKIVGIEIDRSSPRAKSVEKLQRIGGGLRLTPYVQTYSQDRYRTARLKWDMANQFNPNPPPYPNASKLAQLVNDADDILSDMQLTNDESNLADVFSTRVLKKVEEDMKNIEQGGPPVPRLRVHKAAILQAIKKMQSYPD